MSALSGHGEIAYGNAIGSVICNAAGNASFDCANDDQRETEPYTGYSDVDNLCNILCNSVRDVIKLLLWQYGLFAFTFQLLTQKDYAAV